MNICILYTIQSGKYRSKLSATEFMFWKLNYDAHSCVAVLLKKMYLTV